MKLLFTIAFLLSGSLGAQEIYPPGKVIRGADPFLDTSGRVAVECQSDKSAVIVVLGQSLSVNNVDSTYKPKHRTNVQMNVYDGRCYLTQEPMLGINLSGPGKGTWMSRFADKLIDGGHFERVVIVPIAVGATTVSMWADESKPPYLPRLIRTAAQRVSDAGLACTAVMWGQGESDTAANTTSTAYSLALTQVMQHLSAAFQDCPILVASESYYYGKFSPHIRKAQRGAVDMLRAFPGEDVDSIGKDGRYDNTHLNAKGADLRAGLAVEALVQALKAFRPSHRPSAHR